MVSSSSIYQSNKRHDFPKITPLGTNSNKFTMKHFTYIMELNRLKAAPKNPLSQTPRNTAVNFCLHFEKTIHFVVLKLVHIPVFNQLNKKPLHKTAALDFITIKSKVYTGQTCWKGN